MVRNIIAVRESVKQAIGCLSFFFWGDKLTVSQQRTPSRGRQAPLCRRYAQSFDGCHRSKLAWRHTNREKKVGGTARSNPCSCCQFWTSAFPPQSLPPTPPKKTKKTHPKIALDEEISLQHHIQASGPQTSLFWVKLAPFSQQEFFLILQQDQACRPYL